MRATTKSLNKMTAMLTLAVLTQTACFNTYIIEKDELKKLESSVEQREVVEVYGDCTAPAASDDAKVEEAVKTSVLSGLHGTFWAQVDAAKTEAPTATDATSVESQKSTRSGCTKIPVSTTNTITLLTKSGDRERVTPFNFVMSPVQLISPEYDLLLPLSEVSGAEVRQFSTWKTVTTIVGVSALTIGAFVAISVFAPSDTGFSN